MDAPNRVLAYATDHWNNKSKRICLDEQELKAAKLILEILSAVEAGDYKFTTEEFFTHFEDDGSDPDWKAEDEVLESMQVYDDVVKAPGEPNMIRFGEVLVDLDKVKEAVEFYGSRKGYLNNGSRIRPPLATMRKRFSFIKDVNHLHKIRDYETKGIIKRDRSNALKFLAQEMKKEVFVHLQEGRVVHDDTLRFVLAEITKKFDLKIDNFNASHKWIASWKKAFGLSSRKITKFVTEVRLKNKDQLEKDAKKFVESANLDIARYAPSNIFNADQSGFQFEMYSARTLAIKGSQHVHCAVQSMSSITHSYTVMPLIAADGTLHERLFVNLKEPKGKFPKKGHFDAPNLEVTCHTSHIMTKNLMKTFFEKMVFGPSMPKDTLLLVDSWSSWKDKAAIDSVTPPSNKVKVLIIPPGCTSLVQPCDVGLFGGFKKVVKTITAHGQISDPKYKIFSRDPTLKLISLVWRQLCSPKLRDWARYAWHASGYNLPRPAQFHTPYQLLFPRDVARDCDKTGCKCTSFIRCLYCEKYFCFLHFVICYHECT